MDMDRNRKLTREILGCLPPLCTDGAWGTELLKLGGAPGDNKDVWNLTDPEKVFQVARAYVEAGSQIILTNTFSANRTVLESHCEAERAAEISRAGAEISRRAAGTEAYVFGSIGPTGKMVSLGDMSIEDAEEVFAEQAAALESGGVDAIVVETQADLEEARAAVKASLRVTELPVGVSFTFDSGKDSTRTMMGVTIAQAYDLAVDCGAAFVGANCGQGIESYVNVARRYAECGKELPLWIKGNAGKPELGPDGQATYGATPEVFAVATRQLLEAGVRFIGGCCGSTPDHIRAIADVLKSAP